MFFFCINVYNKHIDGNASKPHNLCVKATVLRENARRRVNRVRIHLLRVKPIILRVKPFVLHVKQKYYYISIYCFTRKVNCVTRKDVIIEAVT